MLRFFLSRYNLFSLIALAVLVVLCSAVGIVWWQMFFDNLHVVDWLLVGIWGFMFALLCWDVRVEKDVPLFAVAAIGGLVIEAWGTNTELWRYFTRERPPLWIGVAWPVASLSTERMAFVLDRFTPTAGRPSWRAAYWLALPLYVLYMTSFLWPTIALPWSKLVVVLMASVVVTGRRPRRDLVLMAAGSVLGIFLEYWGTSRHCWTYYTEAVPPPVAVFAHGFTSVAFARCLDVMEWLLNRIPALRSRSWSVVSRVRRDQDPVREAP